MKFYRRLKPFKAISFDLDDTLYDNAPIMHATENAMQSYFIKTLAFLNVAHSFDFDFWYAFRQQVLIHYPHLIHDVGELREAGYALGMQTLGLSSVKSQSMAHAAQQYFNECRSNFTVPESSHRLLENLQKKYPLVVISNGNANTNKIGINNYFSHVYHAGIAGKQKPNSDMFLKACEVLNIASSELLHVGDCGTSDIMGAVLAGCQTAYVSTYTVGKPLSVLPTVSLTHVEQLTALT